MSKGETLYKSGPQCINCGAMLQGTHRSICDKCLSVKVENKEIVYSGVDPDSGAKIYHGTGLKDKRQSDNYLRAIGEVLL